MKYSGVFVLSVLGLFACTTAAPDCMNSYTSTECAEYTKTGGGRIVLEPFTDTIQLTDERQDMLKVTLANVSNKYVIVAVEPQHVVITTIDVSAESGNKVTVHFFVVNPTGSIVMPVAFRSNELYLLLKVNKEAIGSMLEYEVTALEPDSGIKLPIPTWALAIIIYAGLVLVIGLIYVGTKDLRHQWSEAQEAKLRQAVMGDGDMELDPEAGVVKTGAQELNANKSAKMFRDTQISFGVQVNQEDIARTLGITYALVEGNGDVPKPGSKYSPPPEKSHAPPAYQEATRLSEDDNKASASDTAPVVGEVSVDETEAEATAVLEGTVNAAYDGDEDEEGDQTTSL